MKNSAISYKRHRFPRQIIAQGRVAAPPLLGEHTVALLRQSGYSDDEIDTLQPAPPTM